MNDNEEKIPPFIQYYLNKMEYEGYADFVKLTREYHKEREEYPGKFATQSAHLNDFNRATGQTKQLNYEDGLARIDNRYKQQAYQTAKQHDYKGTDPNQPSDKEFTKQGEKFMGMIDHARQRQQEQAQQKKFEQGQEKKNVEALKAQPAYNQQKAKVSFDEEKAKPESGANIQSLDEQRAAFLSKIKATREQQNTRQQDKEPEI